MRKSTFKNDVFKVREKFSIFFVFHCGHCRCWSQQTWCGIHYLKLSITRNARAASTPFLSTSFALYIIIMLTSTINFSGDIPSTSNKISITTPKWVILPSGDHPFFFWPWTYGNLSSILWQFYFSKDRNSSLCMKWTKVAALIWLFSYKTKIPTISKFESLCNEWLSRFA